MNKNVLSPFDCDLCAMVEDLTGKPIDVKPQSDYFVLSWEQPQCVRNSPDDQRNKAIKQAVNGRLGKRAIMWDYKDGRQSVTVEYDPTEYPEEIRTRLTDPDFTAGQRYCRTLLEVDAIEVRRDNLDDLLRFTGGGTMTIPRTPGGVAVYSFADMNGIFVTATENSYIIRNGKDFTFMNKQSFEREFEPKGIRTVGNYDGKPARPSGSEIMETFNRLFGTDIDSRNRKLTEEYGEYMEAANAFIRNPDDRALFDAMVDELGDLNAVVFHIAGIVGKTPYELLQSAYDKVIGRQTDPMYKRKHPHGVSPCKFDPENIGECGNCENMQFEDAEGVGYCDTIKDNTRCDEKACGHYEPKN